MAHIVWQTPPFTGRRLGSGAPPTGTWAFQHNAQIPALHEGRASVRSSGAGRFTAWGLYWSRYGFEIRPDDPAEHGPFLLTIHAVVAGTVSVGAFAPGTSIGTVAQLAIIRRLSDGAVIHRETLRARERGRIIRPMPLHDTRTDGELTTADEYRLDLISYTAITVTQPRFQWQDTAGTLDCTGVGAGASVFLSVV